MTTVVTKDSGGTGKPVGLLYIEPERQVLDAGGSTLLAESGLDAAALADVISGCLAHLRCGVHLYRSAAGRTTMSGARSRFERFAAETLEGLAQLEEAVAATGGDPNYLSPAARAAEKAAGAALEATFMISGSIDPDTAEVALLDACVAAETKALANWELLATIATQVPDGPVRVQLDKVAALGRPVADEHLGWASWERTRLLFGLASGGMEPPEPPPPGGEEAVDVTDMTRDQLYSVAQHLDIEGRSNMTKDELADAVAHQQEAGR